MSDLKICKMGHYFAPTFFECPYCPQGNSTGETTILDASTKNIAGDKTEIFGNQGPIPVPPTTQNNNMDKTQIFSNSSSASPVNQASARKLVAWLVTFYKNNNGVDFKLYEGRNVIGSAKSNDIVIGFDSTISSKHLTILFRANEFLFEDELSTNGTFINGIMTNKGSLKDGDVVKIAETEFLFRTAFKQS